MNRDLTGVTGIADAATRRPWPAWIRGVRAAAAHLTRLPVGGFPYSDADWRWSGAHLPLVGGVLGAVLGGVWLAGARAGGFVAAVVVVAVSLFLTGALHEDGLADTADALGGGRDRERVLAILKDSRIGSFGSAALTISLLLRIALLARLDASAPAALVLAGAASRFPPLCLMAALPYVTPMATSKSGSIVTAGGPQVFVGAAWVAAVAGALVWLKAIELAHLAWAFGAAAAVAFACAARFRARVGGITGDFLGATQQATECAMLLALALALGGGGTP
jgi:adenosylcobinamide-GDP ribazoletransferase